MRSPRTFSAPVEKMRDQPRCELGKTNKERGERGSPRKCLRAVLGRSDLAPRVVGRPD